MEIQQHDGVVVEVAGISAGLRQAQREGVVLQGKREALGAVVRLPSLPPLYIGPMGGRWPWEMQSPGGRRPRGGFPPPQAKGGAPRPTRGWFPSTFSPRGPPGQVAPPGGPPGPFRWSRYNTDNPRNHSGD